ncbi:translocation and assembly module lipoprotein TamL [Flectobacillus major]|uniref:translocation and assembly module lipoprotein TamL n=1 Tax=Flectobacillus major TaxID=103 RepID=UPI0005C69B55|nr:BamA/TamA family outer membrane protein [Flectobacillus major]
MPTKIIIYLIVLLIMSSCSVSRKLPAGESLYTGAEIIVQPDSSIKKADVEAVKVELTEFVRPKPNSNIFGFPYRVWLYYLMGEPKKEKGLRMWFRKKFGEPPVLASKGATTANAKQINSLLNNQGFFRTTTSGDLVEKSRMAKAVYKVRLKARYYIDSVTFQTDGDTSAFGKAFADTRKNTLLKKGTPYQFDKLLEERTRIERELRVKGFYYFRSDYILFKADSVSHKEKVDITVEIKTNVTQVDKKVYRINDIHVIADYGENLATNTSSAVLAKTFRGIQVIDPLGAYRPKIFSDAIGFRRGGRYSSRSQDISLSRLINLKNFKFVKNTFELVPRSDSALLDVYYYLTPLKNKSFQAELSGFSKSNNFNGTDISLKWQHLNLFKGAEIFSLSANAGLQFQVGGGANAINNSTFGITSSLTLPRFAIPFLKFNPARNQSLPSTTFNVAYNYIRRGGLYKTTSLTTSMAYDWSQNATFRNTITPISITYVKNFDFSFDYIEYILTTAPEQLIILESNTIIPSSSYQFSYTPRPSIKGESFTLSGSLEVAGNLASIVSNSAHSNNEAQTILGVGYAQYARADLDFRYYKNINSKIKWANRVMLGFGLPYGNSKSLPFVKQYIVGGSNSIRAFVARSVGPGTYKSTVDNPTAFLGSQTGDMKLELNTEIRAKLNGFIQGAMFVDAGNVWIYKNEDLYGKDGLFGSDFYKQLAIGAGLGIRFDFTYLLLRFDLATPLHKPYLAEGERWVIKDIDFGSSAWRKENLILNIAMGLPF